MCWSQGMCLCIKAGCQQQHAQVPRSSLERDCFLLFSVLMLGITSSYTFLGFHVTFCYTWMYLNPAEDIRMTTAVPLHTPLQQVQQPPATACMYQSTFGCWKLTSMWPPKSFLTLSLSMSLLSPGGWSTLHQTQLHRLLSHPLHTHTHTHIGMEKGTCPWCVGNIHQCCCFAIKKRLAFG